MGERKSILFVEPDREFQEVMRKILENSGYEVVAARDGREALNILSDQTVDLIISALNMPHLDGIELMEEINRIRVRAPVIFVTACGDVESYMDVMNMGAFDYLNGEIKGPEVLHATRRALGEHNSAHGALTSSRVVSFA